MLLFCGLLMVASFFATPISLLVLIIMAIMKKELKKIKRFFICSIIVFILSFAGLIAFSDSSDGESTTVETELTQEEIEEQEESQIKDKEIVVEEELQETEDVVEDVVEDESEFYTTKVVEENGETEYIKVPITRTVNGIRIRTVTTETEGLGIVKIIATADIVEGLDCLEEYGFSSDEIKENEEILASVGIEEIYVSQYVPNGDMGIFIAYIYDSEGMQLNVTFENNTIIAVQLTGIVDKAEYSTRDDELDVGVGLQGHSSVDLYYDIDGGALAYLDWENKTLDKL